MARGRQLVGADLLGTSSKQWPASSGALPPPIPISILQWAGLCGADSDLDDVRQISWRPSPVVVSPHVLS